MTRVLFVAEGEKDLRRYLEVAQEIERRHVGADLAVACASRDRAAWVADPRVRYAYADGVPSGTGDAEAVHARMAEQYRRYGIPLTLFRADRRYVVGAASEAQMAAEQVHLVDWLAAQFDALQPGFVFLAGGPDLSRSIACILGNRRGIATYRILNGDYFNPGRRGARLWFCANNYRRASDDRTKAFAHDKAAVHRHVEQLLQALRAEATQLDRRARSLSSLRSAFGAREVGKCLARAAVDSAVGLARERRLPTYNPGWRRLRARLNYERNRRLAADPRDLPARYFLLPLNIPEDAQLTLRAPQYVDQLAMCSMVAAMVPFGCVLVLREHPGQPGMLDHAGLRDLLRRHANLRYIDAQQPIEPLLDNALALLTINSTSALEAMMRGVPVVTLGESYYRGRGLAFDIDYPFELQDALSRIAAGEGRGERSDQVRQLLCELVEESYPEPGVLTEGTPDMARRQALFVDAILAKIQAAPLARAASG